MPKTVRPIVVDGTTDVAQYTAIKKTAYTDSQLIGAAAGVDEEVYGFLQELCDEPNQHVSVVTDGETYAIAGGALNAEELVTTDADGKVVQALGVYASPTGVANSAFTLTSKIPGKRVTFALTEDGASQVLKVFVEGDHIRIRAKTTAGSAQDNTTDEIKTAIAAHDQANALVTIADLSGHDGSGKPAAIDFAELAGWRPCGTALEDASGDGSIVRIYADKGAK